MTDILERFGIVRHKTFNPHSTTAADASFLPEIMALLQKLDARSSQAADMGTLWKYANLILRYTLEWLCLRNRRCSAFDIPLIPNYSHAQLLALLMRYDTPLIQSWFKDLNIWSEKFTIGQRPAAPDLPRFRAFVLQLLHSLQKRSPLVEFLLEDLPIVGNTPLNRVPPPSKPGFGSVDCVNLARVIAQNGVERDTCPICHNPFQTTRYALKWCPTCQFYRDYLNLGVGLDNMQHEPYLLKIEDLVRDMLIFGGMGEGKSNTVLGLTHQAREHQIPTWVFACDKQDHRKMIYDQLRNPAALKDCWIFTVKHRLGTPFCLNPFPPPPKVPLETHLENFAFHFTHSYGMDSWGAAKLRRSVEFLLESLGWDISLNTFTPDPDHPNYPLPLDLIGAVEQTLADSYQSSTRQDLVGYLLNRVRDFNRLSLGYMWNVRQSIPWDELLSHNIVFELQYMDVNSKQFFVSIMLRFLFEYLQSLGEYKGVRLLVVIEEASSLFSKQSTGDNGLIIDNSSEVIETFFSLGRAYGVSLVLVDQTPERLPPRALTLANTMIIHNLKSQVSHADLKANCPKLEYIPFMGPGEAVIAGKDGVSREWTVRHVKIHKSPHLSSSVSDQALKDYMAPFYAAHPWFKTPDPDIAERIRHLNSKPPPLDAASTTYGAFLLGLSPQDLDPGQAFSPTEVDATCAGIEADLYGPQGAPGERPSADLKQLLRTHLEDPRVQAQLQPLQELLAHPGSPLEHLEKRARDTFNWLVNMIRTVCPPTTFLSSLRFTFRLLTFKYLHLTDDQRLTLFMKWSDLLAQYLTTPSQVKCVEIC